MSPGILLSLASIAQRTLSEKELAKELHAIMGQLGDQEFRNALDTLDNATRSPQPRIELISAVNHLQSAATKFEAAEKQLKKSNDTYSYYIANALGFYVVSNELDKRVILEDKHAMCYAMIATIYNSLATISRDSGDSENRLKYGNIYHRLVFQHLNAERRVLQSEIKQLSYYENKEDDFLREVWFLVGTLVLDDPSAPMMLKHLQVSVPILLERLTARKQRAILFLQSLGLTAPSISEIPERIDQFWK